MVSLSAGATIILLRETSNQMDRLTLECAGNPYRFTTSMCSSQETPPLAEIKYSQKTYCSTQSITCVCIAIIANAVAKKIPRITKRVKALQMSAVNHLTPILREDIRGDAGLSRQKEKRAKKIATLTQRMRKGNKQRSNGARLYLSVLHIVITLQSKVGVERHRATTTAITPQRHPTNRD